MSTAEDEAKRAAIAEELAQVNVLRVSQVIGHAGVALLDQLSAARGQMPATVLVTNAMLLANAVHANEKNRAMAFRKKPAALTGGGPLKRLEMVRLALPGQAVPAAAGSGGDEAKVGAAPGAVVPERPSSDPAANAGPSRDADHVHTPEVITGPLPAHDDPTPDPDATPDPDEMPPAIQFASQALDLAIAAAAETAPDPLATAVLRAMARSRGMNGAR